MTLHHRAQTPFTLTFITRGNSEFSTNTMHDFGQWKELPDYENTHKHMHTHKDASMTLSL